MDVMATFPQWLVWFEDGLDTDFNDFVFTVDAFAAGVACAPVERGQTVTCEMLAPVDSVQGWQFVGVPALTADTLAVSELTSSTTWQGEAVLDGTISTFVWVGGVLDTLETSMSVQPRPWSWGPSDWTFTAGGGAFCNYVPLHYPTPPGGVRIGLNTRAAGCAAGSIEPDILQAPTSGYSDRQVPNGPNAGAWYVESTGYHMDRGSSMNPDLAALGTKLALTGGDRSACRSAGLATPDSANFFTFNEVCKNSPLDSLFAGIERHEGFGTPPSVNGHEVRRQDEAALPSGDPRAAVEHFVRSTAGLLESAVTTGVWSVDQNLATAADGAAHAFVHSNWNCTQKTWVWHTSPGSPSFKNVVIEIATPSGPQCN
jgi:hypothetical protein